MISIGLPSFYYACMDKAGSKLPIGFLEYDFESIAYAMDADFRRGNGKEYCGYEFVGAMMSYFSHIVTRKNGRIKARMTAYPNNKASAGLLRKLGFRTVKYVKDPREILANSFEEDKLLSFADYVCKIQ